MKALVPGLHLPLTVSPCISTILPLPTDAVDYAHAKSFVIALRVHCLNPCFNGIYTLKQNLKKKSSRVQCVLILVLMEYGLRQVVMGIH